MHELQEEACGWTKSCATCIHFNIVPGMQKTGVCDSNVLNKRAGVPIVLTASNEVCWEWEPDKDFLERIKHDKVS